MVAKLDDELGERWQHKLVDGRPDELRHPARVVALDGHDLLSSVVVNALPAKVLDLLADEAALGHASIVSVAVQVHDLQHRLVFIVDLDSIELTVLDFLSQCHVVVPIVDVIRCGGKGDKCSSKSGGLHLNY